MFLLSRELQRDVKTLRKVVEQMSTQMDSQAVRERPKIAALLEEVNVIKETMNIQVRLELKWAPISFEPLTFLGTEKFGARGIINHYMAKFLGDQKSKRSK